MTETCNRGRPWLLDAYCGAGGAAKGYQRAGFNVIGIDINPQPDFCGDQFIQGDVIELLPQLVKYFPFSAIHASPPCQASCALIKGNQRATAGDHIDLIPQTRVLLEKTGLPTIIENVQGATVRRDLTLCGEMFGLDVIRHRYFECSFPVAQPAHVKHRGRVKGYRHGKLYEGVYWGVWGEGGGKGTVQEWKDAMDMQWTDNRKSIAESIPHAYTKLIGDQLMGYLNR